MTTETRALRGVLLMGLATLLPGCLRFCVEGMGLFQPRVDPAAGVDAGTGVDAGAGRDSGTGKLELANPVLDGYSETELGTFRCAALGMAQTGDVVDQNHVYGTYWPARCGDGLPPGSITADGGKVLGCRTSSNTACWWPDGGFTVESAPGER